jgi:1-acyl-sn-glycerol-3-phosphate acyltransferase
MLAQAMEAGQPITAAHIRYRLTEDNGPYLSLADVCFWDDTLFARHVFRLLALRGIEVELRFAESPIAFSPAAADRRIAAQEARAAVLQLRNTVEAETVVP